MEVNRAYGCRCGKAFLSKVAVYSCKNSELDIFGSGTVEGSNKGTPMAPVCTSWNSLARTILWSLNPLLWSVSVSTKNTSCMTLKKYCWKNWFDT